MAQYGYTRVTPQAQTNLPVAQVVFDEATACFVDVSYFDVDGAPFTPVLAQYRIDDQTSGEPIVPWTSLTVGATNQITVTSAQNALISLTRSFETHQLTVEITDSAGDVFYARGLFDIRRTFGPVPGASSDYTADSEVTTDS